MKADYKKTLAGSIFGFILGTSCCWLTALAFWLGGAAFLTVLSRYIAQFQPFILGLAFVFLVVAMYQFWKHKTR